MLISTICRSVNSHPADIRPTRLSSGEPDPCAAAQNAPARTTRQNRPIQGCEGGHLAKGSVPTHAIAGNRHEHECGAKHRAQNETCYGSKPLPPPARRVRAPPHATPVMTARTRPRKNRTPNPMALSAPRVANPPRSPRAIKPAASRSDLLARRFRFGGIWPRGVWS